MPPRRRAHSAQSETRNGERRFGGLAQDAVRPGSCPSGRTTRLRRTHSALGLALEKGTPSGGWQRTQLGQGVIPGKLLRGRNGEERSPATGYAVRYRPDGNCVATVSVRSAVVADGPERVKPAVPLPVSGNCAAAVWGSGRSLLYARPQGEDREAFQPLRRRVSPKGRGIRDAVLFLSATSLSYEDAPLGWGSTPGTGFPDEARPCAPVGFGFGWGAARGTRRRLSLGEDRARSNAPSPSPDGRSDQLQPSNGCPAEGAVNSDC